MIRAYITLRRAPQLAFAAIFFLLAICAPTARAQSGLLLGLNQPCGFQKHCVTPYSTLWIAPQGKTVQIMTLPDLIVPRETGFWRVGVRTYCTPEKDFNDSNQKWVPSLRDTLFALPVNQRPVVRGLLQCSKPINSPCTQNAIDISFVNSQYISLRNWAQYLCGVHPDGSDVWTVQHLGDPRHDPIAYASLEGAGANNVYQRRAVHSLVALNRFFQNQQNDEDKTLAKTGASTAESNQKTPESQLKLPAKNDVATLARLHSEYGDCFPRFNDTEWYINRGHGRWNALGGFDTKRLCGVWTKFPLPFHAAFAGPATTPISLATIKKQVPHAYDDYWSPNHRMLVVLSGKLTKIETYFEYPSQPTLKVFIPHGHNLGKPVITTRLKDGVQTVMAEWATGHYVAKWTKQLTRIKAQGVMKPRLIPPSKPTSR